jgi:hypothetical protein
VYVKKKKKRLNRYSPNGLLASPVNEIDKTDEQPTRRTTRIKETAKKHTIK